MECPVCNLVFKNSRGLINHVLSKHKLSMEEAYLLVNEKQKCIYCEEVVTDFISYEHGYKKWCNSPSCRKQAQKDAAKRRLEKRYNNYVKVKERFEERTCIFCGKLFKPIERDNAIYCSRSCATNGRFYVSPEHMSEKRNTLGKEKKDSVIFECPITKRKFNINTKSTSLSIHLTKNNINHYDYFEKYLPEQVERCVLCGKPIRLSYTLGKKINKKRFCNKEHYHEHKRKFPELYFNAEANKKISQKLKEKISNNEWTPCVTNSWSRSKVELPKFDMKFRSSWEALFWLKNRHCEYESLRIPYNYKDKTRTYIVDFIDKTNKFVYEIKPKSEEYKTKNIAKENQLKIWAKGNQYSYVKITEFYFLDNLEFFLDNDIVLNNEKLKTSVRKFSTLKEKHENYKDNKDNSYGSEEG